MPLATWICGKPEISCVTRRGPVSDERRKVDSLDHWTGFDPYGDGHVPLEIGKHRGTVTAPIKRKANETGEPKTPT